MLVDIAEERGGSQIIEKWDDPQQCHFPLWPWYQPLHVRGMCAVYGCMWLGALGITVGFWYRITSVMFAVSYWYVLMLDRIVWNNHSYLFGLCSLLYSVTDANRCL